MLFCGKRILTASMADEDMGRWTRTMDICEYVIDKYADLRAPRRRVVGG